MFDDKYRIIILDEYTVYFPNYKNAFQLHFQILQKNYNSAEFENQSKSEIAKRFGAKFRKEQ